MPAPTGQHKKSLKITSQVEINSFCYLPIGSTTVTARTDSAPYRDNWLRRNIIDTGTDLSSRATRMGGQSNMQAKTDLGESIGNGVGMMTKLLHALRHGAGGATAAGTTTPISDGG